MMVSNAASSMFAFVTLYLAGLALAAPQLHHRQLIAPTVVGTAPEATYIGSTSEGVDTFNGIPFAEPPTGTNRLYAPSAITTALGIIQATGTPTACPQMAVVSPDTSNLPESVIAQLEESPFYQTATVTGEDCLNLNIQRPAGTLAGAGLPVIFWIYGGGFEFGSTQTYDASKIIQTSVSSDEPVLYVAVNYRLSAFGFLPGSEVKEAGIGNLGLLDQRIGLKWVADNIADFGGDPSKVTIWGESAGSISVFDQLALYDGDNKYKGKSLFHGAIMDSGSIVPANPIDGFKGKAVYANVVEAAGCTGNSNTLQCLREVPYETYLNASNSLPGIFSYDSVALAYLPRPDGVYLTESPELLVEQGKFAMVPFIIGDQEDEGTIFSLTQTNTSTTAELVDYFHTVFFPHAPRSRVAALVATYPDTASAGSPFRDGPLYEIYPQYKRLAAIIGDLTFILTRRIFLDLVSQAAPSLPTWSYLSSYLHATPVVGTFHGSDLIFAYEDVPSEAGSAIVAYYISFFNYLTPNRAVNPVAETLPTWPNWDTGRELLHFQLANNTLLTDNFREKSYNFIRNPANVLRI